MTKQKNLFNGLNSFLLSSLFVCLPAYPQSPMGQGEMNLESHIRLMDEFQLPLNGYNRLLNTVPFQQQINLSQSQLYIPKTLPKESQEKISKLWIEIINQCSDCSTGVTISGGVITGPNVGLGGTHGGTLFPIKKECDSVSEQELKELKRKASLYDKLNQQKEN